MKFRRNFQNDMVLIQPFINIGDLALAEGIAQDIIDVLNGDSQPSRGIAIDRKIGLQALILLVGIDIAQFRNLAKSIHDDGSPVIKIVEIVSLQSVLILGATEPAADGYVLHGLQKQRGARNVRCLAAKAGDDMIGVDLSLVQGLQLSEHARRAGAISSTGECGDRIDRRVCPDDIHERAHFLGHFHERSVLISLNEAIDAPGILLGEEALIDMLEHVDTEACGKNRDAEDQELVAQDPTERDGRSHGAYR